MQVRMHRSPVSLLMIVLLITSFLASCKKSIEEPPVGQDDRVTDQALISIGGNVWTELTPAAPSIPTSVTFNMSFSVSNKLYSLVQANDQLWEYDPSTAAWSVKKNNFTGQPTFTYVYLFTNGTSAYFMKQSTKEVKAYDFATSQWGNKASFPGTSSGAASFSATATKGYIMGGTNGFDPDGYGYALKENWEYDFAANTWQSKANLPGTGRYNAAAYAIGDKIYFGTGISILTIINPNTFQLYRSPVLNSDWWEYNTLTNTWTAKAAFGGGKRQDTRGFMLGNKVYLGLGTSAYYSNIQSDLWSYDATANAWTQKASYPPGNGYPPYVTFTACNGRGYAVTGNITAFWRYTPPQLIIPLPTNP
ncbi:hypothetical protein D3H65_04410 [Paraflavitalea soli]|uniref:Galactose oxidase n=1 Tax=Paraflavitalea soli TaxID=2315862 RepID=A0A3B7MNX2_9BACT|nr:hypothetical protein [Paraflavitalea soli]AXY73265.1 hypothetical protein D3H65_04410 [Paraflavitalea soli]